MLQKKKETIEIDKQHSNNDGEEEEETDGKWDEETNNVTLELDRYEFDLSKGNGVSIQFWINSFIPWKIEGVTSKRPNHPTDTMIEGPMFWQNCFLTDQRNWSSSVTASSRMHSVVQVNFTAIGTICIQKHWCDETVEVNCRDGKVLHRDTAKNDRMNFKETIKTSELVQLELSAAANNPLIYGSCDIDISGTVQITKKSVKFVGKVDPFPAFEAYVSLNGKTPQLLAKLPPGKSVMGLCVLKPNRKFAGNVSF